MFQTTLAKPKSERQETRFNPKVNHITRPVMTPMAKKIVWKTTRRSTRRSKKVEHFFGSSCESGSDSDSDSDSDSEDKFLKAALSMYPVRIILCLPDPDTSPSKSSDSPVKRKNTVAKKENKSYKEPSRSTGKSPVSTLRDEDSVHEERGENLKQHGHSHTRPHSDERNKADITQKKPLKEESSHSHHRRSRQHAHTNNQLDFKQKLLSVPKSPKAESSHHRRRSHSSSQFKSEPKPPTTVHTPPDSKPKGNRFTGSFRLKTKNGNIKSEPTKFQQESQSKFRSPKPKSKSAPAAISTGTASQTKVSSGTRTHDHTSSGKLGDMNRSFLEGFEMPTKCLQNMAVVAEENED